MKPPLIAIADDDLAFATYLKTFLELRGYQSRIYAHGEALLAAAHALFDLPAVEAVAEPPEGEAESEEPGRKTGPT